MLRPRANEIGQLIRRLGSRTPARVDAARARLSVLGPRAVEDLITALEGDDNRVRARVMPLLALIQDPRARQPLIAMLLDRNARLRAIAARCLARFPSPDAVAALARLLDRETREQVRTATVHALVEQYVAGREEGLSLLLELLADPRQEPGARRAALTLLPHLRGGQRRSILDRLSDDPDLELRRRAEELAGVPRPEPKATEVRELVAALGADDYPRWNEALQQLAAVGPAAIDPLLTEMQARAHDPEYCTRAGMVLKALGPRRGRAVADALERVEEPLPLQVLVEVIGALGEKALIYRLKDLIERVGAQRRAGEANGTDPLQRVRAKAHLELARIGSRVAVHDLRRALGDPERRVEIEMLAAIELIGKRDELATLLTAYDKEDDFMRERIAGVVRSIMRRERIRRNNNLFRAMGRQQQRALAQILPPRGARRPPHEAPRP